MNRHFGSIVRRTGIIALLLFPGACAGNLYEKFYQDSTGGRIGFFERFNGEPAISRASNDPQEDVNRMFEKGYAIAGVAAFNSSLQTTQDAIAQAKKIGASHVILIVKHESTTTGVAPITTPTTSTTYHSGSIYGSSGSGYGSYSGTSTSYGTETSYIPYTVEHYDQTGLFFQPLARTGLGVRMQLLTAEQKQLAQTNEGVLIIAIRRESPAFKAELLPGDILLTVGEISIYDNDSFLAAIEKSKGREVAVLLRRQGTKVTKKVLIPAGTW